MNQKYWQNAFGNAPEEFHLRLTHTLEGLEEREMKQRFKFSTALVAAVIAVVLVTGAAFAASQLGIFKFYMNRADPILPLDGVEEMAVTNLGSVENDLVTVTVEEALYDGQGALVQIRYTPKDPENYVLLSDGLDFEKEGDHYISRTYYEDGSELIQMSGRIDGRKDIICGKNITLTDDAGGEIWIGSWDGETQEDGSIVIWGSGLSDQPLSENVTLNVKPGTLICGEWNDDLGSRETERVEIEELSVPMPTPEPERHVRYEPVDNGEGERFKVLSAEVSYTKLCAYLSVDYSYEQQDDELMGITFRVYGADGEPITLGTGSGSVGDDIEHWSLEMQSFDEIPESLWFEAKVIGEDVTLGRVECRMVEE